MDELVARVREVLSTTPDRWRGLTATIDLGLMQRRPAPGEWSAFECLEHLLDTEVEVFPVRIQAFLDGRDFANFDPDEQGSQPATGLSPAEAAAKFGEARVKSLIKLEALVDSDLDRTAGHSELGQVTLRELLNEWAAHDLMHTVQAERA
ncbi:MAG TPA: DinB family protein, partial [Candidatus Limnocylindrales bacterium]